MSKHNKHRENRSSPFLMNEIELHECTFTNTQPQWLLRRYCDESYILISQLQPQENKLMLSLQKVLRKYKCILPENLFLLFWNILIAISIIFNLYQIPISLFFTSAVYISEFHSSWSLALNICFLILLFINMVFIRPLTGFYQEGKLISSKNAILKKYIKAQFWFNFISWLSLFLYILSGNPNFIYQKILFYLSIYPLIQLNDLITLKLQLMKIKYVIYKLIRLILVLLLFVFWIAGIFFAIDYKFYVERNSYYPVNLWLTNSICSQYADGSFINLVETYEWQVWLAYAVYWTLQSVSLLGYGDITPRNPQQVAFCDVIIVVMTLAYALFISNTWQIMSDLLYDEEANLRKTMKHFEKNYQIKPDIAVKLSNYAFEAAKSQESEEKELEILQILSDELKRELILTRQKQLYNSIPFFNEISIFNEEFAQLLYNLALLTQQNRYGVGEKIYSEKYPDINLCLVVFGSVQLTYQNSYLTNTLHEGQFFGSANFLCKNLSSYQAKASKFSKVSELKQKNFIQVLKKMANTYEKYRQLFDQLHIYESYSLTGEQCWACRSKFHLTHLCPQFFEWLTDLRKIGLKQNFPWTSKKGSFRKFICRRQMRGKKICIKGEQFPDELKKIEARKQHVLDRLHKYKVYNPNYNF